MFWKNKKIFRGKNNECKIQNILNLNILEYERNQKNKNQKKFFSIAAPHRQPAQKGEGVSSQKVGGIYSAWNSPF